MAQRSALTESYLLAAIDDGFCIIEVIEDAEGKPVDFVFREVNAAFERQAGFSGAVGHRMREFAPDLEQDWFEVYARIARTGVPERFELFAAPLDRWYNVHAFPTGGPGQRQVAVLFRDVTDRKKAEAALRNSEARYRAFVTASSDVVYRMNPDWTEMRELDGRGFLADTAEPNPEWRESYIAVEDREMVDRAIQQAIDTKSMFELEHRVRVAGGSFGWTLSRAVPIFGPDGAITEWLGAARDITHRKEAEDALRKTTERLRQNESLLAAQKEAFLIAMNDAPLTASLGVLVAAITDQFDVECRCAFYIVGEDGTGLFHVVGMPEEYAACIDGFPVAPESLACGLAVAEGRPVITPDVLEEPRWAPWLTLAHDFDYRGCWSFPVETATGKLVGSMALYFRDPHMASQQELDLVATVKRAAAIIISRHQQNEERVRSEERLRQFGEASQDVLWIRDARTLQWQYLTPAFEAIYGLSRQEALTGNNYRRWTDLILPADRERAVSFINRALTGEKVSFDYRIRRPVDGTIRWLKNTDFPILDDSGKVTLIGGIGHDLTDQREAELRLQSLMEGIPQLVWRAAEPGKWTWSSPQWLRYTGQSGSESLDWGWLEALHPEDRTGAQDAWANAEEAGGFEVEYRIRRASDAGYRWFQTRATPVRDDAGTIIEWLGTSTDIHDLRVLQERQRVLVGELQHRTRNLMGVIRAIADRTGEASSNLADFLDRFQSRLDALARVQGLLSRLEKTERVTFDELIETELEAMDGAAQKVTLSGPPGIQLRSSMVQVLALALHELATNAVKYGALGQPDGELSIEWRLTTPDPDGRARLRIEWRESNVDMPAPGGVPRGSGHGRELIELALPYQLNAETSFELGSDGVRCVITLPLSASISAEASDHE